MQTMDEAIKHALGEISHENAYRYALNKADFTYTRTKLLKKLVLFTNIIIIPSSESSPQSSSDIVEPTLFNQIFRVTNESVVIDVLSEPPSI